MLVHHILEKTAVSNPDKDAFWDRGKWYTYSDLNSRANLVAAWLLKNGLERGERVGLLLKNSFEYVVFYFGILKADGVVVGLNQELKSSDLEFMMKNSEVRFLLSTKLLAGRFIKECSATISDLKGVLIADGPLVKLHQESNSCVSLFSDLVDGTGHPNQTCDFSNKNIDLDLAEIVYTSGSTGVPKGVMLSHLNLCSNMRSIVSYFEYTGNDRIMVILPFYYIYGKSLLLTHFMVGGSVVVDNGFMFPEKVLNNMTELRVTGFAGVPSTFAVLLDRCDYRAERFPMLRYMAQAGGALAPSLQDKVIKMISPADFFVMYGATEAAPRLSWLPPKMIQKKMGSIGIPVNNVELKVVNQSGVEVSCGEMGEIVARGSNIMMGYWGDQESTDAVIKNGFYYTGDLGYMDEDGYFFVKGRSKEFLKVRGFRVSAREIEEKILLLDEVSEVAVIGIPDEALGEAIKAFIVFQKEKFIKEEDILKRLSKDLPTYKLPKHFAIRNELPKNDSGKILKTVLKDGERNESN